MKFIFTILLFIINPLTGQTSLNSDLRISSKSKIDYDKKGPNAANDEIISISQNQTRNYKFLNLSLGGLFAAGGSTVDESAILQIQGGAHDPKKQGITLQNLELSFTGAVDPYFYAETHLIFQIDPEGESTLEVEEVFLLTQTLPFGLQVKAGTYFTEFGRLNPQHPHSWSFVDQPIINTRFMGGDGLRGPGARISWLSPLPWYSEIIGGIHNANGETMASFLSSEANDSFAGYPFVERETRTLKDFLWTGRWMNTVTLGETVTTNLGLSGLWGPNRTGVANQTSIKGLDVYIKWKPILNNRGFPFLFFQGETMWRSYEAGGYTITESPPEILRDSGFYAQLLWGFTRGWVAGIKSEKAQGDGDNSSDPFRDQRSRWSANLTWYPSEYSKLRINYNFEQAEHREDEKPIHSLWFQFEFRIGQHAPHKF